MQRWMWLAVLAIALAIAPFGVRPALASSTPAFSGAVNGVEVCPQQWCGAAIFVGQFDGSLMGDSAGGGWWVAIRHGALPYEAGGQTDITGGRWGFSVGGRYMFGTVDGGALTDNGDNTYSVDTTLTLTFGGTGSVRYTGTLSHNALPPGIAGSIQQ